MLLALPSCVTTSVFAAKSSCSELLDGTWETPVADAAAPQEGPQILDTLKSWINFGGAQTAGKRSEFERAQAARRIIRNCEAMQQEAIEKAKPKFLGIF